MFSHEELAEQFKQATENIQPVNDRPAGTFTTAEIAEALNVSQGTVLSRVRKLVGAGKVEMCRFQITTLTGHPMMTTGYRFVERG